MAKISDHFEPLALFPTMVSTYHLEFDEQEAKIIDQYTDDQYIEENGANMDGPEPNFRIAWMNHNPLIRPEFDSIKKTILNLCYHYLTVVNNSRLYDDTQLNICDSWFVKLGGDENLQKPQMMRKHNHAFAMLTCIIYLDDTNNGFNIHNPNEDPLYPFVWKELDESRFDTSDVYPIDAHQGKCLIFPSRIDHSLMQTPDPNDHRRSMICNIWPSRMLSDINGIELNTDKMGGMTYREFKESMGE